MDFNNLNGTGIGTPYPAATDVAKETGTTQFGGHELIDDPSSPHYIGHGIGHRDPETGTPIHPSIHVPTRGETHPSEFTVLKLNEADLVTDASKLESKFGINKAGKYHANWFKMKSRMNGVLAKVMRSDSHLEKSMKQGELAKLELSAFEEENGGYSFAKH
ncbi:hypothetical protein LPJ66_000036 [Kickxella alabastrina]|uniref:Uncharacterized protein n=1 Tax=Kickxella alabastrina TaxID=61397 RepID=A0ACC1IX39_9FUNG|nr:hypothetical protein LPJ66_000036 [Kickxella alabastrina]